MPAGFRGICASRRVSQSFDLTLHSRGTVRCRRTVPPPVAPRPSPRPPACGWRCVAGGRRRIRECRRTASSPGRRCAACTPVAQVRRRQVYSEKSGTEREASRKSGTKRVGGVLIENASSRAEARDPASTRRATCTRGAGSPAPGHAPAGHHRRRPGAGAAPGPSFSQKSGGRRQGGSPGSGLTSVNADGAGPDSGRLPLTAVGAAAMLPAFSETCRLRGPNPNVNDYRGSVGVVSCLC